MGIDRVASLWFAHRDVIIARFAQHKPGKVIGVPKRNNIWPVGFGAGPPGLHGRQRKKGDPKTALSYSGDRTDWSPCRPSGALATPDHSKGVGGNEKRAIRRPPSRIPV